MEVGGETWLLDSPARAMTRESHHVPPMTQQFLFPNLSSMYKWSDAAMQGCMGSQAFVISFHIRLVLHYTVCQNKHAVHILIHCHSSMVIHSTLWYIALLLGSRGSNCPKVTQINTYHMTQYISSFKFWIMASSTVSWLSLMVNCSQTVVEEQAILKCSWSDYNDIHLL